MPTYFFDFDDGEQLNRDDVGLEFEDHEHAVAEATLALTEFARDAFLGKREGRIQVIVMTGETVVSRIVLILDVSPASLPESLASGDTPSPALTSPPRPEPDTQG